MENNPEQRVHDNSGASVQTHMNSRHSNVETQGSASSSKKVHDHFRDIISSLRRQNDTASQLVTLEELCDVLPMCPKDSIFRTSACMLSPLLVNLAKHNTVPDVTFRALKAITCLCDFSPESVTVLVSHDVVPAICQRLHAIEYFDVAEQCLQVLKRISEHHPLACLDSGAIMAVLSYIDFFSPSIQRVALCTMENICHQMLPSQGPSPFMDAVPILSKLLKYKDGKLVQDAASCLIKIGHYVDESSEIDELCKHDLIENVTYLLSFKDRTVLHQDTYIELISLLAKLCSGSVVAFWTLHELNICSILEDILLSEFSYGASSSRCVGKSYSQVYEALMLLNQLLPAVTKDLNDPLIHDKEYFLANLPDGPQKLGMEMFPKLIQVFNSNTSVHVSHGCLSVMYKLVYWGKSDMFVALLKRVSISSFLTGAFTWKDHHVLILALQISELILQKFSYTFLYSFTKEGIFFVIDKLLSPETSSNLNFCQKLDSGESPECPCYANSSFQSRVTSEVRECKLDKDSIYNLSKHIIEKYLAPGLNDSKKGLNDILMNLKILSADLNNLLSLSIDNGAHPMIEEKMNGLVHQILEVFSTKKLVSIFNLIEIGAVKSLVNYLSSGQYMRKSRGVKGFCGHDEAPSGDTALALLIRSLRSALAYLEPFPVILSNRHGPKFGESFAVVPNNCSIPYPSLNICFIKDKGETCLDNYSEDTITVDPFYTLRAIEEYLWPKVRVENSEQVRSSSIEEGMQAESSTLYLQSNAGFYFEESPFFVEPDYTLTQFSETQDNADQEQKLYAKADPKLSFYLEGKQLHHNLTLYQAILCQKVKGNENFPVAELWNQVHTLTFRRAEKSPVKNPPSKIAAYNINKSSFLSDMFSWELVSDFNKSNPTHDILFLLTFLEESNRFRSHLVSRERIEAFALGEVDNLDNLKIVVPCVAQNEFVSKKLTDKLENQMRDSSAVSICGLPPWFNWLLDTCPFLFSFEARCKCFKLAAYGQPHNQAHPSNENTSMSLSVAGWPLAKVPVSRNWILESAAMMMNLHAGYNVVLEAVFNGEIGAGRGPTMEFYSLVSQGFQKSGLGMWREDNCSFILKKNFQAEESMIQSRHGLFPRPWLSYTSDRHRSSEVATKFFFLGQVVAKAIQDGRILDLHLSKAFYKLILGKDLSLYDIESFDPELGRMLLEFVALVSRKKYLESACREKSVMECELSFRGAKIDDLCLDFTLPGYPDIVPSSGPNHSMVTISNLEDYVSFITDATVRSGISKQMKAFKSGFDKFFPIKYLHIFNEEELERILCGEQDSSTFNEIANHIKFNHGYTATSPPIVNLLEIIQEFDGEQRRAFMQFVTGSPRLPLGGLASLNPKLTVVRKGFGNSADTDLPSVMTCVNYLKLPPYSSKEIMKEKLLYAITEGQQSFYIS